MYKIYIHSIRQMMKLWSADRLIGKEKKKVLLWAAFSSRTMVLCTLKDLRNIVLNPSEAEKAIEYKGNKSIVKLRRICLQ